MLVPMKDYYKTLNITPDADEEAIKAAYRRLARRYHPDVTRRRDATERFMEVKEAYEVLSNPDRRRLYDSTRRRQRPLRGRPRRRPGRESSESPPLLEVVVDALGLRIGASVRPIRRSRQTK